MTQYSKPIPEHHQIIMPYLIVEGAANLIRFLQAAFDGEVMHQEDRSEGVIMHAEVKIADCTVMMADATKDFKAMPANLYIYVGDTDASYQKAIEAGGITIREPYDESYGARAAGVQDPVGNVWWLATLK
ncbi:MAG: VOC family protein [Bacteroidota bacterium]